MLTLAVTYFIALGATCVAFAVAVGLERLTRTSRQPRNAAVLIAVLIAILAAWAWLSDLVAVGS